MHDVDYDNAKFRHGSRFKVITQALITSSIRYDCGRCSTGKFLVLLMIAGLGCLMVVHKVSNHSTSSDLLNDAVVGEDKLPNGGVHSIGRFWRKPPRLPPDEVCNGTSNFGPNKLYPMSEWISRRQKVKEAFHHAWSGYKSYAFGYDELMPLSHREIDGLGGLGATIIDSLDTAMIMGADEIVSKVEMWIEEHLMERINTKGQVNLFETTIHVLGGLLSAYHISGGEHGTSEDGGISVNLKGVKSEIFLKMAKHWLTSCYLLLLQVLHQFLSVMSFFKTVQPIWLLMAQAVPLKFQPYNLSLTTSVKFRVI